MDELEQQRGFPSSSTSLTALAVLDAALDENEGYDQRIDGLSHEQRCCGGSTRYWKKSDARRRRRTKARKALLDCSGSDS